jgi:hypothetical protein
MGQEARHFFETGRTYAGHVLCRLVWNKYYMLSEIFVKVFRSGRKLVGPGMFCIKDFIKICDFEPQSSIV